MQQILSFTQGLVHLGSNVFLQSLQLAIELVKLEECTPDDGLPIG